MFVLYNYMRFIETLCKQCYASLFVDPSTLKGQSVSDSSRYSSDLYLVKSTYGPMGKTSFRLLEISGI